MKNKIAGIFIIATLLLFTNSYVQGQKIPQDPALRKGKLSNGLTYYIRHNENPKGKADFYIIQKVGSILEEEDQRGLAHFLEHMAFNGTKNFPGNTIIDELEKKGIKFGININASTGYNETVYQLIDIPVSNKHQGMTDTALLILHDWAGLITNDESAIDKERKIVHEEWRTRSTAELRVLENGVFPVIYAGTPYADRIPIGNMDVVDHFKPGQLQAYYKKWYRSDLQAIIVVGDIDVDRVEAQLKALFEDIPAPLNPSARPEFQIPDNQEPIAAIAKDTELKDVDIKVFWKFNDYAKDQKQELSYYKTIHLHKVISNLFLNRFYEIKKKADQPFIRTNVMIGDFLIANTKKALSLNLSPVDSDSTLNALERGLTETERLRRFGFSSAELLDYKRNAFRLLEREHQEKNNRENFEYIGEYTANFIRNNPVPDAEWRYQTDHKLITELSLDSLNLYIKELVTDKNMVFVITGPDRKDIKLPVKEEILSVWGKIKQKTLVPYSKDNRLNVLEEVHPVPGKLVKTEQKPFGYIQWTFANGLKVRFKQTSYKENAFLIKGYSPGGLSAISTTDLPSAMAINSIANQTGVLDPESNAEVNVKINSFDEEVRGVAGNLNDIKTLFKLIYLRMTGIDKEPFIFNQFLKAKISEIKNQNSDPKVIFADTLASIMSNHHPRAISLNHLETLAKVDYDKLIKVYKQRICNARGFTFFLTGNANPDSVLNWAKMYIGSLPLKKDKLKIRDYGLVPPTGFVKKHFKVKMNTRQSTVTIGYTGKIPYVIENTIMMNCLSNIMKLIFTEKMRMQEGGTYDVGVSGEMFKFPDNRFIFQTYFDANPKNTDKLISIFYQEIKKISLEGPAQVFLQKAKTNLLSNHPTESATQNAGYWELKAFRGYVYGIYQDNLDYRNLVSSLTKEMVSDFAKQLFSKENLIEVVMSPAQ